MASFAHFRILLTLLAALAAFFGYACRLNLSLVLEEMVIKLPGNSSKCLLNSSDSSSSDNNKTDINIDSTSNNNMTQQKQSAVTNTTYCLHGGIYNDYLLGQRHSSPRNEEHMLAWYSKYSKSSSGAKKTSWPNQISTRSKLLNVNLSAQSLIGARSNSLVSLLSVTFDTSPSKTPNSSRVSINQSAAVEIASVATDVVTLSPEENGRVNWTDKEVNDLLGAFFWGYVISQIPGARAAEIFGAKSLFLIAGLGAGLCTLAFPLAAKAHFYLAFGVRVVLGLTQGAMFPAIYVLLSQWLPGTERSSWLPVPSSFSRIGIIVMNFVIPFILKHYDWETVFYAFGFATLMWSVTFSILASNSPQQSFWISKGELIYIETHMNPQAGPVERQKEKPLSAVTTSGFKINEDTRTKDGQDSSSKPSINWFKVIGNRAILLLSLIMFSSEWSNFLLMVKLPGFLNRVLRLELDEIGIWSSILIAIFCIQFPLSGLCATKLASSTHIGTLNVRKIFEAISQLLQGTGCLIIAFSKGKDDRVLVFFALIVMMFGRSTVGGGQCLMPPELSKDYPGTVFAFANTLANMAGVIGPMVVSSMVNEPTDHRCWFGVWILSAAIFYCAGAVFCLFGENKPQNYCKKHKPMANGAKISPGSFDKSPIREVFKLDTFSRVSSEPNHKHNPGQGHLNLEPERISTRL